MAIAVAGSTLAEVATGTSLACNVPAGTTTGDLLVAVMTQGVTGPVPDQAGWTLVTKASQGTTPTGMWYRWGTASEPASYTLTSSASGRITVSLHRVTGVDATTPLDAAAVTYLNATSTSAILPSITTVTAGAMVLYDVSVQTTAGTVTPPASVTTLTNTNGVDGRRQLVGYESYAAAGATGTRTFTISSSLPNASIAVALRPATVSTPTLVSRALGIPTDTSIEVATRTTIATSVRAQCSPSATFASGIISGSAVTPNAQGDAILTVTGLSATSDYYTRIGMTVGGVETFSAISSRAFRTDNPGVAGNFSWSFSSCDDAVDAAVWSTIAARNDDFFLQLGDWFHDPAASSYADGTGTDLANMRAQLAKKLSPTNHAALLSGTPMDFTPSDHDSTINNGNAGNQPTALTNLNAAIREILPLGPYPGTTGVYKTWTRNRVRFIKLDRRSFASSPAATDDSSKTCLGTTQKQWLKDTITASPAGLPIVIVQESPWVGSAIAGDDGWAGYTTERTELANFFAASGKPIIMLAGDMHAVAADDGTNAPGGIRVWHAAPLNNAASVKGGPYTAGPYPASGTAVVSQYGRCVVTDTGSSITLAFTGYSADNTARVTDTVVVDTVFEGSGAGSWSFTGAGSGQRTPKASGSGSFTFTGVGSGTRAPKGSGSGTATWTGTGTGARTPKGAGAGSFAWVGTGAGVAPDAGVSDGSGSGEWGFTGVGSGTRASRGSGSGTYAFVGAGTGVAPTIGPKSGSGGGAWSFIGTGAGSRASRGSGAGTWAYVGSGAGEVAGPETPAARSLIVAAESRTYTVPVDRRVLSST